MSASRSLLQIWRETICTFKFQGEKVSSKNFAPSEGKANSVLLGPWARHTTSALPRVRSRRQDDKCALKKFFNSVPGFLMGISSIQGTWWHHIKHSALYNIPSLCSDGSNTAEPSGFCITYLSGHKGFSPQVASIIPAEDETQTSRAAAGPASSYRSASRLLRRQPLITAIFPSRHSTSSR